MVRVLFECHYLYYLPQFLPIIKELKNRGDYNISISLSLKTDVTEQKQFKKIISDNSITAITAGSESKRITKLVKSEFDVIFIGNIGQMRKIATKKSLVVMVYHGIGLKQSYYRDMDDRIDLRAVESETRYHEFKAAGARNLVQCGFTKLDPLFQANGSANIDLPSELELDSDRKTILYAPTFYPSSLEKLLPVLPELNNKFNIVVKLHSFGWHHRRYKWQSKLAQQLLHDFDSIKLITPDYYNILPLYQAADCLVSDISSTLFEFLALNRPIIKTEFCSLRLKHRLFPSLIRRRLDLNRGKTIDFSYNLFNPGELTMLLTSIFQDGDDLAEQREKAAIRYLYKIDGLASKRLIDVVETRLNM